MREVKFETAFMFAYSQRDRTRAARRMLDSVPAKVKSRRLREIINTFHKCAEESNAAELDTVHRVLVEGRGKKGRLRGRTDSGKPVDVISDVVAPGNYVDVLIESASSTLLTGSVIGNPW